MTGLWLPVMELQRWLADHLGVFVCYIYPNAWRIFLGAEVLWGQMSGGLRHLTLDKFFFCYIPQQIAGSKGFYNFIVCKAALKLVTDVPDSNHDWKSCYLFVQGSNWLCRLEEWDSIGDKYDNTWGILNKSCESSDYP